MDDILKYGVLGVAKPIVDKLTDTSANDARMSALEKDNEDYKKQLAEMQQAQSGQGAKPMKKGGMARSAASKRADGCVVKGFTRAK
jgi:hypothetical protein